MHIKRWAKKWITKEVIADFFDECFRYPPRRWSRLKRSWISNGLNKSRWSAFRYWVWRDVLGECLGWFIIILVVIPTGCWFEWRGRRRLIEGKMYRVGGEKFAIPFMENDSDKYPFKVDNEMCYLHDTRTGKTDSRSTRSVNSGDVLVLVRAQEGELGTFEDEGEWIFLHPTGCLVSLNWDRHRLLLWTLRRLRKPKAKTKKKLKS